MWATVGLRVDISTQQEKPEDNRMPYAENNCNFDSYTQIETSFKIKVKIKTVSHQGQSRESVTQSHLLKEILKDVLQVEEREPQLERLKCKKKWGTKKLENVWINLNVTWTILGNLIMSCRIWKIRIKIGDNRGFWLTQSEEQAIRFWGPDFKPQVSRRDY